MMVWRATIVRAVGITPSITFISYHFLSNLSSYYAQKSRSAAKNKIFFCSDMPSAAMPQHIPAFQRFI